MGARLVFCALLLWPAPAAAQGAKPQDNGCQAEPLGTGEVTAVPDGRTLVVRPGREVRLAGIEVPEAGTDAGRAAAAALAALTLGRTVTLKRVGPDTDRHGRVPAHVFIAADGGERSVQQALVAAGQARVGTRGLERACMAELLGFEQRARDAKLGLWAVPYYELTRAEHAADILRQRGRFAVVEGTVLSVRESGGTIYVNFGRRWSEDFTATIAKRMERTFAAAGLEPKRLERRRIRVRGWVEERGGPWIELTRPEQIEVVERKP